MSKKKNLNRIFIRFLSPDKDDENGDEISRSGTQEEQRKKK